MNARNKSTQSIVMAGALICLVILAFAVFMKKNREQIVLQNSSYIEDAATQNAKRVDDMLESAQDSINSIARLYGQTMKAPLVDFVQLGALAEDTSFEHIEFVDKDGIASNGQGRNTDVSDRMYFQSGMQGSAGMDVLVDSRISEGNLVIFYAPLRYRQEIIGILIGYYEEERVKEILSSEFFGERSNTYLCIEDGTVITGTGDFPDNLLTIQDEELKTLLGAGAERNEQEYIRFQTAFRNQESASFDHLGEFGSSTAYLMRLPEHNWMLMQTFPSKVTKNMIATANRTGVVLLAELLCLFVLYVALLLVRNGKHKKQLLLERNEMIRIIDSVIQLYGRFVYVNFEEDSYEYLKMDDSASRAFPPKGKCSELNRRISEGFSGQDGDNVRKRLTEKEYVQELLREKSAYVGLEYQTGVKGERWESVALLCLKRKEGLPVAVLYAVQDITEQKREEYQKQTALEDAFQAAEQANRSKSVFLSSMSHDIRTPMNAIMGMTAIAAMHIEDSERVIECLNKITVSSRHLLGLINEVLDMSKIESGKISLEEEPIDITELAENICTILEPQMKSKCQQLKINMKHLVHKYVMGDVLRLQQIFVNIMGNAVKFTPEGGQITFGVYESLTEDQDVGFYEFVVEDNGIGMEEEFVKHIFEPFTRADNSSGHIEGTGLGMAITKNIIQLMNGEIYVESELGKGTRFFVSLCLKVVEGEKQDHSKPGNSKKENLQLQAEVVELKKRDYRGCRLLLAEDNDLNAEIAEELLKPAGISVDRTCNGKEAVMCLLKKPPGYYNMVLMDIQMPVMDGYQATAEIRALDRADLKTLPIIALTADVFSDDITKGRQVGMNGYVAKPIEIEKLLKVMEQWMQGGKNDTKRML